MKIFHSLPGNLRVLFSILRIATVVMAVFWVVILSSYTWIQQRFGPETRVLATIGEISLPAGPGTIGLSSDTAAPGSLALHSLRGILQVDLCSQDGPLASALRRAILPSMAVLILFTYVLFTALRDLCRNLERGDVFNDENLRLVRRIGLNLIAYSLAGVALELWASHVLAGYFSQHVVLTGLQARLAFASGSSALQLAVSPGLFTAQGGVLIGCLVLVVAEAFRQGLQLKTENDLTV